MRRRNIAGLASELACLPDLPAAALRQRWRALYGADPPRRLGSSLLAQAVAHRLQEQAAGGLRPATLRQLARIAADASAGRAVAAPAVIKPGTKLLRQWNGDTHEVTVLEQGVRYRGRAYRSLTEVARVITGAKWSGPRFFGLAEKRR